MHLSRLVRNALRLTILALAGAILAGCPSLTERAGLPPTIDRAQALESSGDQAGAAKVYEDLAAQNSGAQRNQLLLRAARDYLAVKRADDAARALAAVEAPVSPQDAQERALSSVEVALDRGQAQDAARQLQQIPAPAAGPALARYHDLQARLAGVSPATPTGPVGPTSAEAGPHIALLLPLTGRANGAAMSVRDGFLTAYFQAPARERPRVRIYDTGTESVAEALTQAARQGADFIVGPLTREEVTAAADFPGQRAALLALNFLPPEHPAPAQFYQYALSPEDEARLAARRVLEDHHRRGVALVPSGDWGVRVLAAFKQELTAGGGDLAAAGVIESSRTDYAAAITEVLRLSDSTARWHRLESVLGTKLQFEPRRRGDIQFIFSPAQANIERLLRPQLRFHFAGDIPTYATSDAYEPDSRANEDLDGLMFPDMPWMLGGDLADAVRATTHDAWPSGGPYRGRLFAFGFDSFRLAQELRHTNKASDVAIEGLTGHLTLDNDRHVRRELVWAQMQQGEPHLLPQPTT
jgi:outer membrane PBP1 activator LpoA protein